VLLPMLLAGSAAALTLDEVGELGAPAVHRVRADCACIELVWVIEETDQVVQIPLAEVEGFRRGKTAAGSHTLWLSLADREVLLKEGPCLPIESIATSYGSSLELLIDRAEVGDEACSQESARIHDDLREYQARALGRVVTQHEPLGMARLVVTDRKGRTNDALKELQRTWNALRPGVSQCATLDPEAVVSEVMSRGTLNASGQMKSVRLLDGGAGSPAIDRCLMRVLREAHSGLPVTERRVLLAVTFPE